MSAQAFWERYRTVFLALLILALTGALLAWRGAAWDRAAFRFINTRLASPALDALGLAGYVIGTFEAGLLLTGAFFLCEQRGFAVGLLVALLAEVFIVLLIKVITQQPRPWQLLSGVREVGIREIGLGFPSGHAAQSFLLAYILDARFTLPGIWRAFLYSLAAFVALSRLYVGAHLLVDVLAGALIGLLIGWVWVHSRFWPGRRR